MFDNVGRGDGFEYNIKKLKEAYDKYLDNPDDETAKKDLKTWIDNTYNTYIVGNAAAKDKNAVIKQDGSIDREFIKEHASSFADFLNTMSGLDDEFFPKNSRGPLLDVFDTLVEMRKDDKDIFVTGYFFWRVDHGAWMKKENVFTDWSKKRMEINRSTGNMVNNS